MQYDVFISHSSADLAISEKLYEYLESNGIKCWIDSKNVTGLYARSIIEGIKLSQIMVFAPFDKKYSAAARTKNRCVVIPASGERLARRFGFKATRFPTKSKSLYEVSIILSKWL